MVAPVVTDAAGGLLPYRVVVAPGALDELGDLVDGIAANRWVVIADVAVASLHAPVVAQLARAGGQPPLLLTVPSGEAEKTRARWGALTDAMLAAGCGRDTAVVALGGGVIGDLAGFVAATYMRGLPFVQVPTTLLAMVDASVGGKVAVDTPAGKNLVGAFHPPSLVVIDPTTLATLPRAEFRSGAVEALKHGVIASPTHFDAVATLLARGGAADVGELAAVIGESVAIKARVVADDPREQGRRHVLNFGHTVGHALETLSRYTVRHGEAVAIGMVVEATAAEYAELAAPGTADRIREALARGDLPVAPPAAIAADAVLDVARLDKKARRGTVEYAVPTAIGTMADDGRGRWTIALPDATVRAAYERCQSGRAEMVGALA